MKYEIVDRQTSKVVAKAKTLQGALRAVDRRDNEYGGYRYFHRLIPDPIEALASDAGVPLRVLLEHGLSSLEWLLADGKNACVIFSRNGKRVAEELPPSQFLRRTYELGWIPWAATGDQCLSFKNAVPYCDDDGQWWFCAEDCFDHDAMVPLGFVQAKAA